MATGRELEELRAENEALSRELAEVRETLRAIRAGEVDGLIVHTNEGDRVFTLESAYEPYRVFVEHMQQGAASLGPDGLILYSNRRFGEILGLSNANLVGASIFAVVGPHAALIESLLAGAPSAPQEAEAVFVGPDDARVHALFNVTTLPDGTRCAVVTDVTERVRQREILASREWLKVTLSSIGDAVIACGRDGRITFVNRVAAVLTGWTEADALGQPIDRVFRIVHEATREPAEDCTGRVLRDGVAVTIADNIVLVRRDGSLLAVEDSAAPIRDAEGKIVGAVIVFHDATERRRAQQALRESESRLVEANRAKDDFLATLSHELRTPMQAIYGWAQMLARQNLDAPIRERGLQSILRNSEAQMQLITDVLDVSRIVSGRLRLNVGSVDVVGVVYAALDSLRPAAEAKGIALTTSISAASTIVSGDADRLQQIVWNLLSNAVKFTPRGGTIDVALRRTGSHFAIQVRDSGIGIPPAFLARVFDRFAQADTSTRRQHGGLGLGLSIVRHLTELHGGTVSAESEGEGKGATFVVRLPVSAGEATYPAAAETPGGQAEPAGRLDGLRILVVDDDPDARDLLATVLGSYGANVAAEASADEGLARLGHERFEVLIADIGMPIRDGYELIRLVRQLPGEAGRIPALALTAYGRPDDAAQALTAGFHAHLAKPVSYDLLASVVGRLAGRQGTAA